nr:protocadherin gamma-C3-like [Salvelinus alpinus]
MTGLICGFVFFLLPLHFTNGDLRYYFPEEMKRGSVIGSIAKYLGLGARGLSVRKARIDTEGNQKRYCDVNLSTGDLIVAGRLDREGLCGKKVLCVLNQELVLEDPLELQSLKEEIIKMEIRESVAKDGRFCLDEAHDADIGQNTVQSYTLENDDHFILNVNTKNGGRKYGELVLDKELDCEKEQEINLILVASDGGTPQRSGTVVIHVTVLDANDNAPVFSQAVYKASLPEKPPLNTLRLQ